MGASARANLRGATLGPGGGALVAPPSEPTCAGSERERGASFILGPKVAREWLVLLCLAS